ncbi:MAG: hypothetical protein Q7S34_01425 [bacterium]|nr:hypothetical protein [bacterium]
MIAPKKTWFKVAIFVVVFVLWFTVSAVTAFFWTIFLVWWAFRLDSRILGWIAIAFLVLIPVTQYFDADERAEQIAVYVYFLLVIVVTLQIIEFRREGKGETLVNHSQTSPQSPQGESLALKGLPLGDEKPLVPITGRSIRRVRIQDIRPPHSKKL